jgi:hypothetical protein
MCFLHFVAMADPGSGKRGRARRALHTKFTSISKIVSNLKNVTVNFKDILHLGIRARMVYVQVNAGSTSTCLCASGKVFPAPTQCGLFISLFMGDQPRVSKVSEKWILHLFGGERDTAEKVIPVRI